MDLPATAKLSKAKALSVPFYAVPGNVKASSEIINEARASVRSIDTKRPFTPKVDQRRLFENNNRRTRPSSACKLDGLIYETSDLPISSSSTRLNPLHTQQAHCHGAKSRDSPIKASLSQCDSVLSTDEFVIGRKITSGRVRLPSISPNKACLQVNLDKLPEDIHPKGCEDVCNTQTDITSTDVKPDETIWEKKCRLSFKQIISMDGNQKFNNMYGNPNSNEVVLVKEDLNETYFNSSISPLLRQLVSDKKSGEIESKMCTVLRRLYDLLQDGHFFESISKERSMILKIVFKLFDSKNCSLLLQAARICLAMNVTGNNLASICKVLFKVTRNDYNDTLFLDDDILELYLRSINSMNPLRDTDALIYGIGSLKFLALNANLLREISRLNGVEIICCHMKIINDHKMNATEAICDQIFHVLLQLTGCLRNLAENPMNRKVFIISGTIDELSRILSLFAEDLDIIMNIARILSKLTMYFEVCNKLTEIASCFPSTINLLDMYKNKQDVIVRLCFALGNVAAKNDIARQLIFQQPNSLNVLLDLIQMNLERKSSGFGDRQRDLLPFTASTLAEKEEPDISEDIVVKVIRLLTNMSISLEVGQQIAQSEKYIDLIMAILGAKDMARHEELVFSALATLSNVSYYSTDNDVLAAKLAPLVTYLLRFLSLNNTEILIENLRVLGNISRTKEAKTQLANMKVIQTAVGFLESENKDVVYLSCGLLMNFMTEESNRLIMTKENGLEKILKILKQFGQNDWQLASIICQTLWNYTCSNIESADFSELCSLLNIYLDENQAFSQFNSDSNEPGNTIARDIWQLEFHPVAYRLLQKIQHQCYSFESVV